MARPCDVDHVQLVLLNRTVQMHVDKVLTRHCAPVADHQGLHMGQGQWLAQQGVVIQVELPYREVVGSPPVGIHLVQQIGRQGLGVVGHGSRCLIDPGP